MEYEEFLKKVDNYGFMYWARSHVSFVLTMKCPVGCRHCVVNAGKEPWGNPRINSYRHWIESISEAEKSQSIVLTGGEPFAVYEVLLGITSAIRRSGMLPSVLTSAYWARTESVTESMINQLVDVGLAGLGVSVDKFHQERIPIQNVLRAIRISKRYGLKVGISYRYFGRKTYRTYTRDAICDLSNLLGDVLKDVDSIILGRVQKEGRAHNLVFPQSRYSVKERPLRICTAISPCIWPDGNVSCCCGIPLPENSPLVIGNLNRESFAEVYQRFEEHPLLPFLQVLDLTELVSQLKAAGLGKGLTGNVRSEEYCSLCRKILSSEKNVEFFANRFNDLSVRRELGVKKTFLYGDAKLFLRVVKNHEDRACSQPNPR